MIFGEGPKIFFLTHSKFRPPTENFTVGVSVSFIYDVFSNFAEKSKFAEISDFLCEKLGVKKGHFHRNLAKFAPFQNQTNHDFELNIQSIMKIVPIYQQLLAASPSA